ncbi:MAG: glycosyltransferase [Clostridia bacterium]|nr:glycosyltransferase [Clostridia bacterium]
MKVSLCIPMFNESKILPSTLEKVSAYMKEHFEDYEVVFSDDGSTDGSAEIVRSFPDDRIRVTGYEKNRGKGCAVRTGILDSTGDIRVFTDCDLAYEMDVVKEAAELFEKNPDASLVIGSRAISKDGYEGYSTLRKIASKTYLKVLKIAGGLKCSDSQTGIKAFTGEAAEAIFSECETDGFAFDFEVIMLAQKKGLKILEFPVKIINQRESKVHVLRDAIRMTRDIRKIKKRIKNK